MFQPDPSQRRVIETDSGRCLVLAPPGCGKTQILTERVIRAHAQGVPYADMLLLTFTNRAARGMAERIQQSIGDKDLPDLFIGNIHRYCSQFLFDQNVLPIDASIISEEDSFSILANHLSEDENRVMQDFRRRRDYVSILQFSSTMQQICLGHEQNVRLHPESITKNDIEVLQELCRMKGRAFDRLAMIDIYHAAPTLIEYIKVHHFSGNFQSKALLTLEKMRLADLYTRYKSDNNLFDFNDLLILTYDALLHDSVQTPSVVASGTKYHRYTWIQIDEVQDLSPLQMAIVDQLTAPCFRSVMYLGDEQQAIFSFMGAKLSMLMTLKERCHGNVCHLSVNHRSPAYLLNVFNDYARDVLNIPADFLPQAANDNGSAMGKLSIIEAEFPEQQVERVATQTATWLYGHPDETTAIVVQTNKDADTLSENFTRRGIKHFKVSGQDVFESPQMKLLTAHLDVAIHDNAFISWTRIFTSLGISSSAASARDFIRKASMVALNPADLLLYPNSSYMEAFVNACDETDLVVFDTETTGLDVTQDDILQIAAVKMRRGKKVEGSEFCVYLETDRQIPEMLGDIPNPIIEERKHHPLLQPAEAIRQFLDYSQGCTLLGHNSDFDYFILKCNKERKMQNAELQQSASANSAADALPSALFDTLRLARLLIPRIKSYKLKNLLETLNLEGENSHLADDDVNATVSLAALCLEKAREILPRQRQFLASSETQRITQKLATLYAEHYKAIRSRLLEGNENGRPAMVGELADFYNAMLREEKIKPLNRLHSVLTFLANDVIDVEHESSLLMQLQNHLRELGTYKESDLCGSSSLDERVFITTIHKAKGLEFDNVIVFDIRDDRLPSSRQQTPAEFDEKKRILYVAMTRAKQRLVLAYTHYIIYYGEPIEQHLSRFVTAITHHFDTLQ